MLDDFCEQQASLWARLAWVWCTQDEIFTTAVVAEIVGVEEPILQRDMTPEAQQQNTDTHNNLKNQKPKNPKSKKPKTQTSNIYIHLNIYIHICIYIYIYEKNAYIYICVCLLCWCATNAYSAICDAMATSCYNVL